MEESFQSNWLHEKGQNAIITDAFIQSKKIKFDNLLQLRLDIERSSLNSFLINHDVILKFISKYQNSLNINITVNDNKWEGNEVFRSACTKVQSGLAAVLMNNAATLGIDLNSRDNDYGQTAFSWACEKGHADVVKLLMENASTTMSIDLNAKSNNGNTGFHWACYFGQTSTVELLLNNADALNLDLNSKNNGGDTGFHEACYKGQTSTVKLLLNNPDALNLELNSKNNDGNTSFQSIRIIFSKYKKVWQIPGSKLVLVLFYIIFHFHKLTQ